MENAIHWLNLYQVDSVIDFPNTSARWIVIYPLDKAIQCLNNQGLLLSLNIITETSAARGGEIWLHLTGMICPWAGNLIENF